MANDNDMAQAQIDLMSSPGSMFKSEHSIKNEPSLTLRASTPTLAAIPTNLDEETAKAIAAVQNEYSTRRVPRRPIIDRLLSPDADGKESPGRDENITDALGPKQMLKRGPKSKSLGVDVVDMPNGIKKPLPKKRKREPEYPEDRDTPMSLQRSGTPVSTTGKSRGGRSKGAASKTGSRKASIAGTPAGSSPGPATSPGGASSEPTSDISEDGAVYCICRRPDNHTWMVACDGGCEDWFHGKCVNIGKEDQELVDKYICPACTSAGRGTTTWKPMCRRDPCRRPARLRKDAPSKYCCDECGVAFMKSVVERAKAASTDMPSQVARGPDSTDTENLDDTDLGPLGGAIRPHELKALVRAVPNAEHFRRLGNARVVKGPALGLGEDEQQLPQVPHTASALVGDNQTVAFLLGANHLSASAHGAASARLTAIASRKNTLRSRRALLKDRERFVTLAKERAARLLAAAKLKDLCGYDSRLAWADPTFREWRESAEGAAAFARGSLDIPGVDDMDGVKPEEHDENVPNGITKRPQPNRTNTSETVPGLSGSEVAEVCVRRRCQRHAGWQKLALHDVRFEEAEMRAEMRKVDDEEREIRARMEETGIAPTGDGLATNAEGVIEDEIMVEAQVPGHDGTVAELGADFGGAVEVVVRS